MTARGDVARGIPGAAVWNFDWQARTGPASEVGREVLLESNNAARTRLLLLCCVCANCEKCQVGLSTVVIES